MTINPTLKSWAVDTAIRAVKTGAQTLVASLGATASGVLPSWVGLGADLKIAGLAMAACVLHNTTTLPGSGALQKAVTAAVEAEVPAVAAAVTPVTPTTTPPAA